VKSRRILVGLALLATAGMCACSASQAPNNGGPGNGQTNVPAPTAATSQGATPAAAAPSPTPSGVQDLVISSTEKGDLTAAFVAFKGISLSDIAGADPTPGTTYYAYDAATDTYWALASFTPSSTASQNVQVGFQDGGAQGMFKKVGAGAWQVQQGAIPAWCAESKFFPLPVMAVWLMPTTRPAGLGC